MAMSLVRANMLIFLVITPVTRGASCPIPPVALEGLTSRGLRTKAVIKASGALPEDTRLLLTNDGEPPALLELADQHGGQASFVGDVGVRCGKTVQGWLIFPDLVARLWCDWPEGSGLYARVVGLGPGTRSAWIDAGRRSGIRPGMAWWQRLGGQPTARFEVRFVAEEVCFCTVVPLAEEVPIRPGTWVALWPGPADQRLGRLETAVAYVAESETLPIWLAAPAGAGCPPAPFVSFYRDGAYLGDGVVEARDALFWYARLVGPLASVPGSPASRPAGIQVGDTARIRTLEAIRRGHFSARVFEETPEGALITAGEGDGLRPGQVMRHYRGADELGTVRVVRVQRGYALVRPAEQGAPVPRVGDEVRPDRPPAPPRAVARLAAVGSGGTMLAEPIGKERVPCQVPLSIRSEGRTIGVAVLVGPGVPRMPGLVVSLHPGTRPRRGNALCLGADQAEGHACQDRAFDQ